MSLFSSSAQLPSGAQPLSSRSACALALSLAFLLVLALSACAPAGETPGTKTGEGEDDTVRVDSPTLVADPTGMELSELLFPEAPGLVIAEAEQLSAAAQFAQEAGLPLLSGADEKAILAEFSRLGAETLYSFGSYGRDLGVDAELDPELEPDKDADAHFEGQLIELGPEDNAADVLPARFEPSRTLPAVLLAPDSSPAAVATARASGAQVIEVAVPDPRANAESLAASANGQVIALGSSFGPHSRFQRAVDMASFGELPGGGGLLFPGRHMIALYGHPSGPALGMMGEQPPREAVERVQDLAQQYSEYFTDPVIPAFEIIATVASDVPGPDGNYSNETDIEQLRPYVDAITAAGGYAFLDLQPGQGSFLEQAKLYTDLLRYPHVGLALDPEWKLDPGQAPMSRVGSTTAAEVNEVAEWLAQLVSKEQLPQKGLILHQFQLSMIEQREEIRTDYPELAVILHADGHGSPGEKLATWDAIRADSEGFFLAWKNFYDEDTPMFSPEQTAAVSPQPWFISYQ